MKPAGLATLVLAATAVAAGDAAAQERVREPPDREVQDTVPQDTVVRDTVRPPRPTLGYEPAAFSLELELGAPGSADVQAQPVRVRRAQLTGAVVDSAVLTRTVAIRGARYGGLSGILSLGSDWGGRVGVGVAAATLQTDYDGEDEAFVASANAAAGGRTELRILSLESALRYRIPSRKRLQPYLELGAAVTRWRTDGSAGDVPSLEDATRFEAIAGVGAVIPLNRRFSARLHASTRVFRTPVDPRAAGDTLGTRRTLGWPPSKDNAATTVVVSRPPAQSAFADGAREILDLLRLQVGISVDLGRPALGARPPAPQAPPDTTSPPGR